MSWAAVIVAGGAVVSAVVSSGGKHGSETRSSSPSARTPDQQALWDEFMNQAGTAHQSMLNVAEARKKAATPMGISIGGGQVFPFLSGTQRQLVNLAGAPEDLANLSYLDYLGKLTGSQENLRYGHGNQTTSASYSPGMLSSLGTGIKTGTALYNAYNSYNRDTAPPGKAGWNSNSVLYKTPTSADLLSQYNNPDPAYDYTSDSAGFSLE